MKQYLPMKLVKRGFKVWVWSKTHNRDMCELECYTGHKGDKTEVGLGSSVVTRLTWDLVGKSYYFFSSASLYHRLLLLYRYTVRANRRNLTLRMQLSVA